MTFVGFKKKIQSLDESQLQEIRCDLRDRAEKTQELAIKEGLDELVEMVRFELFVRHSPGLFRLSDEDLLKALSD